jgi:hypothetical protein
VSPYDVATHQVVQEILNAPSGRVMILEGDRVLKLRPIFVESGRRYRGTKYEACRYGDQRSLSVRSRLLRKLCLHHNWLAYTLLQTLAVMLKGHGEYHLRHVEPQIHLIVRKLVEIGLSLYSRNIVGRHWEILGVLD